MRATIAKRLALMPTLFWATVLCSSCEEQTPYVKAPPVDAAEDANADDEVDTDALRRPGTGDYYGAVAGAKRSAERGVKKIEDYHKKIDEEVDDVFND